VGLIENAAFQFEIWSSSSASFDHALPPHDNE
jgi:hypothetical protein